MAQGSDQKANSKTGLHPSGVDDLISCVRQSLKNISRWGCSGFSCTEQTLMKIETWASFDAAKTTDTAAPLKETLDRIQNELGECMRCGLCHHRRHILFGRGSPCADLVFIGQMPSMAEDKAGRHYSGPAGQLLLKMIGAMKLTPEQVYICSVLKCWGPAQPDDVKICLPFLERQLKAIKPKVICTLGESPSQIMLGEPNPIASMRGQFFNSAYGKIMPTLDPAYLMNHPDDKRKVWQDLKKIMAYLGISL